MDSLSVAPCRQNTPVTKIKQPSVPAQPSKENKTKSKARDKSLQGRQRTGERLVNYRSSSQDRLPKSQQIPKSSDKIKSNRKSDKNAKKSRSDSVSTDGSVSECGKPTAVIKGTKKVTPSADKVNSVRNSVREKSNRVVNESVIKSTEESPKMNLSRSSNHPNVGRKLPPTPDASNAPLKPRNDRSVEPTNVAMVSPMPKLKSSSSSQGKTSEQSTTTSIQTNNVLPSNQNPPRAVSLNVKEAVTRKNTNFTGFPSKEKQTNTVIRQEIPVSRSHDIFK